MVSGPDGLVISGLDNDERISLGLGSEALLHIATYKDFKPVQGSIEEGEHSDKIYKGSYDTLVIGHIQDFSQQWWDTTLQKTS